MKLAKIIAAAGLTVAAVTMSTSADAQSWRHDRGHHSSWNNGYHHGWNNHRGWNHHRYCRTEWRHHHRVTICR
jgi:Spy/CpxP family protein refolding chaperone